MLLSILYSGLFLFTGFSLSDRILHPRRLCVRLWLGGCAGLLLLLWLPALWSFLLGFTWEAQLLAGGTALILLAAARFFQLQSLLCVSLFLWHVCVPCGERCRCGYFRYICCIRIPCGQKTAPFTAGRVPSEICPCIWG